MRLLVLLGCAFLLGWVLSWMYYATYMNEADSDSADSPILSHPPSSASPSASAENAGSPLPGPDAERQTANPVSVLDITRERLRKAEFETVMAEYADIQGKLSTSDASTHRKLIVGHAESLRKSARPEMARALLALYLDQEFRDVPALLLMAGIYQDTGHDMAAIEVLYQAGSYAYTPESIAQTGQAIRSAVKNYAARLLAQKDTIARLNLYQRLTELEPEYSLHFIELAETYLALGNAVDARKALALTGHDASVLEQANAIKRRIEADLAADRPYAAEVSLRPLGNQFLVDAVLNNTLKGVFLLDTGASLSIASPELLRALGVPYRSTGRMAWFSTAGGRIQAPIVTLDSLALDGVVVENLEVGVISEFDDSPVDGLLGMNFLRHFEFYIDQNEGKLQLSPN